MAPRGRGSARGQARPGRPPSPCTPSTAASSTTWTRGRTRAAATRGARTGAAISNTHTCSSSVPRVQDAVRGGARGGGAGRARGRDRRGGRLPRGGVAAAAGGGHTRARDGGRGARAGGQLRRGGRVLGQRAVQEAGHPGDNRRGRAQ